MLQENRKLKCYKAIPDTNIPANISEENAEFFAEYIYLQYNEAISSSNFANFFKFHTQQLHLNKAREIKRKTTDQSASFL